MKRKQLGIQNLHKYQFSTSDHILDNNFAGVFLDMGLGKTVSTLTAANILMYEELEIDKALVIAPKRVAENVWTEEIKQWSHLEHLTTSRIIGSEPQRLAALKEKSDLYTIGRDNVAWLCGQYGGGMLPFDMLIIDESSSFKNHDSMRFKALKKVLGSFKRVVILTGTPAPNGLIDLWSQIYLLDRGERLGRTIGEYRRNYFSARGNQNYTIYNIRKNYDHLIHKKIEDICISMKTEDYLTLPDRIDNYIELDFTKSLRKRYDDFKEESVLELIDSENEIRSEQGLEKLSSATDITAASAAALAGKLMQFTNGAIYDEEKEWHEIHKIKLDALAEILEDSNGKNILIAYAFRHGLERLLKRFKKYKPVKLTTDEDIVNWNAGKTRILLLHPASGGHGLNLQFGGSTIVWFGLTWSLELFMQLNKRLHRQGQLEKVIIHYLLIRNTIDQRVISALTDKAKTQESLTDAIKATIEAYL